MDELDLHRNALKIWKNTQDASLNMQGPLSPIEEERRFPASDAPLQVHVTANFHDPAIRLTYHRTYLSSQSFIPTERICRGLVRRIEHCSDEVITRKDSDALNATQCLHKGPKPLRFELIFQVARVGHSGIWAERSFKSYQKHALTGALAKEVLQSTHRIVGMFLRRHDKGFVWTEEPAHDHFPDKPETFKPSLNGTLNLACIPRSLFIESHQTWEFVPGYSLELTFKNRNPARHPPEFRRTLRVDSQQNTPLNLGLGEDLLWQAYRSVQDVLDQKKRSFDLEHANCDGFDGEPDCDCQHFDEDALDVGLRILNNLGPMFEHLHRSVQSKLRLFTHSGGQDCDDFVREIQARLNQFRDRTDEKVGKLHDFDFRIAELTGHGWHEKNCARFIINGTCGHSRRSIQALLDRIRTGVSDILRGQDVAIRMIAYKRGHLVLDKALIARDHQSIPGVDSLPNLAKNQLQNLLGELKTRIQHDIDLICKDTCSIDDILEASPEPGQRALCTPRPVLSSSRPFTPRVKPQGQMEPGSPGRFATQPPTPPVIPTRKASRVFPLVPAKYQESAWPSRGLPPVKDSTVSMNCNGDFRLFEPAVSKVVPPVHFKNDNNSNIHTNVNKGLKPPAEVYRVSKEDYETDSSSTHSSMPALTESDTPSPKQSMLVTPSCVRSSSPAPRGLPSIEDLRIHHFSNPFVVDTSAPSSTTFCDVERFEDPKAELHKMTVLQSVRPETPKDPDAEKSVSVNTPKVLGDVSSDDKTPVPHRSMQGTIDTSEVGSEGTSLSPKQIAAGKASSETMAQNLPVEGWLLCHVEEDLSTNTPAEDDVSEPIAECDSSETLRPSAKMRHCSIDDLAGLRDIGPINTENFIPVPASEKQCHNVIEEASKIWASVPTEKSDPNLEADLGEDSLEDMTLVNEMSSSKLNLFEQEENSGTDPVADATCTQAGSQRMGMSVRSEATGHIIPKSDSGMDLRTGSVTTDRSGSEPEEKHVLSPIDETDIEFGVDNYESTLHGLDTSLTVSKRECASGPLITRGFRRGDQLLPVSMTDPSMTAIGRPEISSEGPKSVKNGLKSAPTQVTDPVKLPKVRTSAPTCSARAAFNAQPSPTYLGLGSSHLLPSLPIFSAFRSVSQDTRASWSTSSSWEDYISTGRQSSDSVDTIKASPAGSEEDDHHPDSPKRLGTPTAGLLGLHESRWAEFGFRTALTGTHAFDRPSTAPVPESPESGHYDVGPRADWSQGDASIIQDSPSSPHKSIHLRQKKSMGSIIMATKLKKKETKELRKQKSDELKTLKKLKSKSQESTAPREDDDGAARFPRAMMLVAGLALASSVVSRHHS